MLSNMEIIFAQIVRNPAVEKRVLGTFSLFDNPLRMDYYKLVKQKSNGFNPTTTMGGK